MANILYRLVDDSSYPWDRPIYLLDG